MTSLWQHLSTHYPRRIIGLSIVVILLMGWYGAGVFANLANESDLTTPNTESHDAHALIEEAFDTPATSHLILFERIDDSLGNARDEAFQSEVARHLTSLEASTNSVQTYQTTGSDALISHDGSATYAVVTLTQTDDAYQTLRDFADNADTSKVAISIGGNDALNTEMNAAVSQELLLIELVSLPILLVLLLIFFRSPVAMLIPIGIAVFTVMGALAISRLALHFVAIDVYAVNVITILGLGLSIDYALLSVNRFREELPHGVDHAVKKVIATSGHTIFFSGATVIACLAALALFPAELMRSIAVGGAAAVAVAVATTYIVLPSTLKLLGNRIDRGRRTKKPAKADDVQKTSLWYRVATLTTSRPITSLSLGLLVIALAFIPLVQFQPAGMTHEWLSRTIESSQVARKLSENFTSSTADARLVAHVNDTGSYTDKLALSCGFATTLEDQPHVASVQSAASLPDGMSCEMLGKLHEAGVVPSELQTMLDRYIGQDAVVFDVYFDDVDTSTKDEAMLTLRELTHEDAQLLVGGPVAEVYDMNKSYLDTAPLVVAVVVVSMIVLLAVALRSIVVPIQAIITNTLGLVISMAVIVGVFQLGWLSELTVWPQVEGIALTAPILVIAIAFGLAMDYSVFLFSRMRETYDDTGDVKHSIRTSITKTGPIITAAALAFFVVVVGLALSSTLMMQIIGLGLAVAVVVDAFFVRLILVPALMTLLGKFGWK